MVPSLFLFSCEWSVPVRENPDKMLTKNQKITECYISRREGLIRISFVIVAVHKQLGVMSYIYLYSPLKDFQK